MNCLNFRKQASLYIHRQLDPEVNQEFFFHLNSCADCFEFLNELRETSNLLGQLGQDAPPAGLAEEIISNLRRTRETSSASFLNKLRNYTLYSRPQYVA